MPRGSGSVSKEDHPRAANVLISHQLQNGETFRSRMRNFKVHLINISLLVCQSFQRESEARRAGKRDRNEEMEICTDHLADCWTPPMSYVLYF